MSDDQPLGAGHARPAPPLRQMTARDREERHRAATPLELFFDLCFVVAVAQAGAQLVHSVAEAHTGSGIAGYAMVFFAVWWAWMNFSWFASAYDTDDVPYRVVTLIQIAGVLILAAGVERAFEDHDFAVVWFGYLVMRLAMVTHWLRAASGSTGDERRTAVRYALGVAVCQVGWLGLLVLPEGGRPWAFLVMALAELAVPPLAERSYRTAWHRHHIAERYGLFTIIVLGETVAAATVAVQSAVEDSEELSDLLPIAGGGLLIVFAAWWIYFAVPIHEHLASNRQAFAWGYGHYLVFGSAAAIGAGIEVAVEQSVGKAHISTAAASAAVTVPSALFLFTVWLLHARHFKRGAGQLTLPVASTAVLACTWAGDAAVPAAGLVCAATVAVGVTITARQQRAHA
ncbi:low temperature requirement protein A [Streptomyces sp. XD-27]|uniref:low temperature requirement protein A n=1 Tax=Streptomyces sp. XD-27 TaxID=3062779 RepID=UPI0026F414FF|nr:low temperature requirement protein A [Streptomyces sp. XD-27]WKX72195.1 low temperature requirement protein A [Streptomyces sp. XD-27]